MSREERRETAEQAIGRRAGRGPRSYRRSDESIREEICESLTRHPDLNASDLQVQVEGGEVTLTGSVSDRDARWLAQGLVEAVSEVSLVHNRLKVG
jgi:osmotically-inducible protein OsmY